MLAIKLQRTGRRHQPSFRLVVAEKRSKLKGPPVEDLGAYDPFTKALHVKKERIEHWIKIGVQPTVTVHNLLVKNSVVSGQKIAVKIKKPSKEEGAKAPDAAAPSQPAVSQAPPTSETSVASEATPSENLPESAQTAETQQTA